MNEDDIQFLETNRHHYALWKRVQVVKHLDGATRTRMLDIIHRQFAPNYIADLWCQSCVVAMMEYLYIQYDKCKENQ